MDRYIGHWRGFRGINPVECTWTPASNGTYQGMFRWDKEGRPWLYEALLMVKSEGTWWLHVRHFGADFVAWEEKEAPVTFELIEEHANRLVWKQKDSDGDVRLVAEFEGECLTETFIRDGQPAPPEQRFNYQRFPVENLRKTEKSASNRCNLLH